MGMQRGWETQRRQKLQVLESSWIYTMKCKVKWYVPLEEEMGWGCGLRSIRSGQALLFSGLLASWFARGGCGW